MQRGLFVISLLVTTFFGSAGGVFANGFCYEYNWAPSLLNSGGQNSDAENADIMARNMTAAQCIGYATKYGVAKKFISVAEEKFLSTFVAGMSEIIEKDCPTRKTTTNAGYEKEYLFGGKILEGNVAQVLTGSMKRSEMEHRGKACLLVQKHYIKIEAKISKR
jgi:hypothetical protein